MPLAELPSQGIIDRIHELEPTNATPTEVSGMHPDEIAQFVLRLGGRMVIDVGKASEEERQVIRQAVSLKPTGHDGPYDIKILGGASEFSGASAEDQVLRDIDREIIHSEIGIRAFNRFLETLLIPSENHHLVTAEWTKFIVGHEVSSKVHSPYETHHWHNVGLKTRLEGDDPLREEVEVFVRNAMDRVREQTNGIFEGVGIKKHDSQEMNEPDNRILALGMAEFSNFARGAILYRYRDGDNSLSKYEPRAMAARAIDDVTTEMNSA